MLVEKQLVQGSLESVQEKTKTEYNAEGADSFEENTEFNTGIGVIEGQITTTTTTNTYNGND